MNELQRSNRWWGRRSRLAIALGLASASMFGSEVIPIEAAWSPLSAFRKPADGGGSKSTKGFNSTIRDLLKQAKEQEEQGNLDRAISLADRAAKVSESAAKIVKPAPDLSPEVTARYANDLRLKKTAQSVKRTKVDGSVEQAQKAGRSAKETPAVAKRADPIEPAPIARKVESSSDFADSGAALEKPARKQPAAAEPPIAKRPAPSNAAVASTRREQPVDEPIEFDLPVVKQPAPPAALPNDSFGEATAADNVPVNESRPKRSRKSTEEIVAEFEADSGADLFADLEPETPVASTPSADPVTPEVAEPAPVRMKMRPRYDMEEPFQITEAEIEPFGHERQDSESEELALQEAEGPTITPMDGTPSYRHLLDEPEDIVPVAADDQSNEGLAQAHETSASAIVDDQADDPWFEESEHRFPVSKVRELQRRLDTAAALNPGEISTVLTASMQSDSESGSVNTAEVVNGVRVVRLRKRRHKFREIPASGPKSFAVDEIQQPAIDITQMVTWRSAKAAMAESQIDSKTGSLPDDLRQSLRGGSAELSPPSSNLIKETSWHRESTTASNSVEPESKTSSTSSTRRPVRGSLWNNAAVPPMDGFSGTIGGASEQIESSGTLILAPPPPASQVEQISFDASDEWASRHRRSNDGSWSSESDSASRIRSRPQVDGSAKPTKNRGVRTDEQSASTRAILTKGPIERFAFLFGVTTSTASSILGAGGFVLFFAGLWMVRAVVRAGKS